MAKKFSELRAKMSAERRARGEARRKVELEEIGDLERKARKNTRTTHSPVSSLCQTIEVPVETCGLTFAPGIENVGSREIGTTARGEMMIADFDDHGRIIRIELVGAGKPCQE
jgi:hypothetical protein